MLAPGFPVLRLISEALYDHLFQNESVKRVEPTENYYLILQLYLVLLCIVVCFSLLFSCQAPNLTVLVYYWHSHSVTFNFSRQLIAAKDI